MYGKRVLLAAAIAIIAVLFDVLLHYGLPAGWALRESWPYFLSKSAFFFVAALVLLYVFPSPLVIGIAGSVAFGWFYYQYPSVGDIGLGNESLLFRLSWIAIHGGLGTVSAALVLRRFGSVVLGVGLVLLGLVGLFASTISLPFLNLGGR